MADQGNEILRVGGMRNLIRQGWETLSKLLQDNCENWTQQAENRTQGQGLIRKSVQRSLLTVWSKRVLVSPNQHL